jgi:hypothetical protein
LKKRAFLLLLFISGVAYILWSKFDKKSSQSTFWGVISVVQNIILPHNPPHPSSNDIKATKYLATSSLHHSFPKNDLIALNDGVKSLLRFKPRFLSMKPKEQEISLSEFYENGDNGWLDLLVYYTIEALLSDEIYSGNDTGYKWLGHKAGIPKPSKLYGGFDV